jgi:hypothetical protein
MIRKSSLVLASVALLLPPIALAQWSAQPGETKRNAFGPSKGEKASVCRGACGAGCPSTCAEEVSYECIDSTRLRRVKTYECGTHLGCREHDDCLDACGQTGLANVECQVKCHEEAVDRFGLEKTTSWAQGHGPYDGPPITFEYTRDAPGAPEPAFRCPEGARLECAGGAGRCAVAGGSTVDPVFDSYLLAGDGGMRISGFRAGRLCGDHVCEQTTDIRVTGQDSCQRGSCTRYGMEFDYVNADPSMPLECSTSTTGGKKDFIGDMVVKGLSAVPEQEGEPDENEHGMRVLLGVFKKVVESADSPEDVRITMAPLGPDGKPIESQRVGTGPEAGPPSTPRIVDIAAPSGHVVVPMYQLADGAEDGPLVREIRCSHKGTPVLETSFRLSF